MILEPKKIKSDTVSTVSPPITLTAESEVELKNLLMKMKEESEKSWFKAMQETWVQFLGQKDPPEKEMATHSRILAWRIPVDRGAWRATVHGGHKSRTPLSA